VRDLVTWLLQGSNGDWDRAATDGAIAEGERRDVRLARPVPVAWTYFTGYGLPDGTAHFRPDIYGLDGKGGGQPISMRAQPRPIQPDEIIEPPPPPEAAPRGFWNVFRPQW
jgi:L,D-transpeptidase YcbB